MLVHLTKRVSKTITTYAEASVAIRTRWGNRPSSEFYRDPSAGLIEDAGQVVAYVSYNGRVWSGSDRRGLNPTTPKATPLYDP